MFYGLWLHLNQDFICRFNLRTLLCTSRRANFRFLGYC